MKTAYGIILNEEELNDLRDALEAALAGKDKDESVLLSWEELAGTTDEYIVTVDAMAYKLVEQLRGET